MNPEWWHVKAVLDEANRYLSVRESPRGSNRGIHIDYWALEAIGDPRWSLATPWCASFVYAIGVQALGRRLWPLPRTASCQTLFEHAQHYGMLHPTPEAGDVFVLFYPSKNRYGHTGFVSLATSNDSQFDTIEGNTNPGGSREGYGVFKRTRPINENAMFIRWQEMIA